VCLVRFRIEEGTYGVVYRAKVKQTDEIVALKRLKMEKEKEGFPITSLREISTLLKSQHANIVTVREIVVGSNMDKIFIVMDYVEHDMKSLMETMRQKKQSFTVGNCVMIKANDARFDIRMLVLFSRSEMFDATTSTGRRAFARQLDFT